MKDFLRQEPSSPVRAQLRPLHPCIWAAHCPAAAEGPVDVPGLSL